MMIHWICTECEMYKGFAQDEAGDCEGMENEPFDNPECPLTENQRKRNENSNHL